MGIFLLRQFALVCNKYIQYLYVRTYSLVLCYLLVKRLTIKMFYIFIWNV